MVDDDGDDESSRVVTGGVVHTLHTSISRGGEKCSLVVVMQQDLSHLSTFQTYSRIDCHFSGCCRWCCLLSVVYC
jgi:hypothetical protein